MCCVFQRWTLSEGPVDEYEVFLTVSPWLSFMFFTPTPMLPPPSPPSSFSLSLFPYGRARVSASFVSCPSACSYFPLILRLPLPCSWHSVNQYNNKIDDNVTNVFGAKFLSSLVPFNLDLDADDKGDDEDNVDERKEDDAIATDNNDPTGKSTATGDTKRGERRIWGLVSKAGVGVGRADNDRQFLYLNGRPVDLPKVKYGKIGMGNVASTFLWYGTWHACVLELCCPSSSASVHCFCKIVLGRDRLVVPVV